MYSKSLEVDQPW